MLFFVTSYLNLSLIFYPYSQKKEKATWLFSLFSLAFLLFLYLDATLYIESILLVSLGLASVFFTWVKDDEKDYFEYAFIGANIFIGLGILLKVLSGLIFLIRLNLQ